MRDLASKVIFFDLLLGLAGLLPQRHGHCSGLSTALKRCQESHSFAMGTSNLAGLRIKVDSTAALSVRKVLWMGFLMLSSISSSVDSACRPSSSSASSMNLLSETRLVTDLTSSGTMSLVKYGPVNS